MHAFIRLYRGRRMPITILLRSRSSLWTVRQLIRSIHARESVIRFIQVNHIEILYNRSIRIHTHNYTHFHSITGRPNLPNHRARTRRAPPTKKNARPTTDSTNAGTHQRHNKQTQSEFIEYCISVCTYIDSETCTLWPPQSCRLKRAFFCERACACVHVCMNMNNLCARVFHYSFTFVPTPIEVKYECHVRVYTCTCGFK